MSVIQVPVSGSAEPMDIDHWNARLLSSFSWCRDGHGYVHAYASRHNGVNEYVYAHLLIVCPPDGWTVDHIDRNPLNCIESNLRLATKQHQAWNRGKQCNNTSGFLGVFRYPHGWRAKVVNAGRQIHVGCYRTPEEAAEAYDEAVIDLRGEFAVTNQELGLLD